MNNNSKSSWTDVFSFTFMQQAKSEKFRNTTIIIGILIFAAVLLILVVTNRKSVEDELIEEDGLVQEIENINTVHILDETKDYAEINLLIDSFSETDEGFPGLKDISFVQISSGTKVSDAMGDIEKSNDSLLINIRREDNEIILQGLLPQETNINEEEANVLLESLLPVFEMYKIGLSGLSEEQLEVVFTPITTSYIVAGEEEESLGETLIRYFVPMIYSFVIYLLLIIYAQSIMNNLVIEKTSKLTEMLLTNVLPEMVITGKILALAAIAILQFLFWILCGVLGFVGGDLIIKSQQADYLTPVIDVIELVQNNTDGSAFSLIAIVLSILALALSFLFYFSFAGVVGSTLNKAEDVSNGTGLFFIPIIFGFLATTMAPSFEGGFWVKFLNYFPFTSPFVMPTNILNGTMSTLEGLLAIGILIVSTIICFIIAGKLYKGLIFFKGEKVSFKNVVKAIKGAE